MTQFVLDYDQSARIEDVAAYFGLTVHDVAEALNFYSRHLDSLWASGEVVP